MQRLKERRDFRAAARGRKVHAPAFVLQWRCRGDGDPARVGFTVTRKTAAGAVERNRIRRRLREAVRRLGPHATGPGADVVIVARRQALTEGFENLVSSLKRAFAQMKSGRMTERRPPQEAADG